ncbi:MAG: alkaline phosphatase family protein, partial [Candidatus Omnitrophica bacterium]|nr:alkaline phosphatase family protein [Candidatus Omnitrophota bacterium]
MVEMGPDRMHHAFWHYMDPEHPQYPGPKNPYESAIYEYYKFLDGQIGDFLDLLDKHTIVLVVSDHGARPMLGGFCINEWLIQEGYLRLLEYPTQRLDFQDLAVDWPHTKAWGEGGYVSRIFLNVRGREPMGSIAEDRYEAVRTELVERLESVLDPKGHRMGNRVYRPEDLYPVRNGNPPDLMCYFGN